MTGRSMVAHNEGFKSGERAGRLAAAVEIQRLREALSLIHEISQETNVPCWQAIQNIAATAATALSLHNGGKAQP